MKLSGMIFDLDGTIADTLPICVQASQEALFPFTGRHFSAAEIAARFGPTEEGMLRQWVPEHAGAALKIFLEVYEREHYRCTAVFPGLADALHLLSERGVRLAIATGKGPDSALISLRYLGLGPIFDAVESGSPDGPIKPQSIRRIIDAWGVAPEAVAYVGDTPPDMVHAREAGVLALGAAWAETATVQNGPAGSAHVVFTSVDDFIRWIEETVEPVG